MTEIYGLTFRAKRVGGGLIPPQLYEAIGAPAGTTLRDLGRGGPLTFLLHGFNVDRDTGRRQLHDMAGLIAQAAPTLDARLVAVLWPGDDLLSPFTYSSKSGMPTRRPQR